MNVDTLGRCCATKQYCQGRTSFFRIILDAHGSIKVPNWLHKVILGFMLVSQGSIKVRDLLHNVKLFVEVGYIRFYQGSRLVTQGYIKILGW